MKKNNLFKNKTILITGGTGSFGNAMVERLLKLNPRKVIVFSRDEKKQFDMGNKFENDKLRFLLGDVRDRDSVFHALAGVNYVFHAAALKHVPNCEFFPIEAIKTNALAVHNVIDAAIENCVERVVVLSTDKAVYPINVMGMTKALMERVMIAAAREGRGKTIFCGIRYGNVMYTRGSVIPYFVELMKAGKPLKVTNKNMTRFMMKLSDSIDLVLCALANGQNGEIYIKKSLASTVGDIARALTDIFNYTGGIKEIGIRPGEKMHEVLISHEELLRTKDFGDYFKIAPEVPNMDYHLYYFKGSGEKNHSLPNEGYTSANTRRLSLEETKKKIWSLEEIQTEVRNFKR